MTFRVGFGLWPGMYFDESGTERRCFVVMMGDRVMCAIDVESREFLPDPTIAIPEEREPE